MTRVGLIEWVRICASIRSRCGWPPTIRFGRRRSADKPRRCTRAHRYRPDRLDRDERGRAFQGGSEVGGRLRRALHELIAHVEGFKSAAAQYVAPTIKSQPTSTKRQRIWVPRALSRGDYAGRRSGLGPRPDRRSGPCGGPACPHQRSRPLKRCATYRCSRRGRATPPSPPSRPSTTPPPRCPCHRRKPSWSRWGPAIRGRCPRGQERPAEPYRLRRRRAGRSARPGVQFGDPARYDRLDPRRNRRAGQEDRRGREQDGGRAGRSRGSRRRSGAGADRRDRWRP